jgi:class 3 adenylate cyclase
VDYQSYLPSNGAPIAFMAAPIFDEGTVAGVLIAELSIAQIDNVVTGQQRWASEGFGNTGETYIVGPDQLVRSERRAFYENKEKYLAGLAARHVAPAEIDTIRRYDSPILHQKINNSAVVSALAGDEGSGVINPGQTHEALASWGPLAIPELNWVLITRIDTAEAFQPVTQLKRDLWWVGLVILVLIVLASGWLARSLTRPLSRLTKGVNHMTEGDYKTRVRVTRGAELMQLGSAFNTMAETIEVKARQNEQLLTNVLPRSIANRLRSGEEHIADSFDDVSVLFADLVGFTAFSGSSMPHELVMLLNELFSHFDNAAREFGVEKIKTVGDAYMAACGLPEPVPDHLERTMRMAIRMIHICREHALEHHEPFQLRIGMNSGPVVAGVIGTSKYIYDLWGDTVNMASRMESSGLPGMIHVTRVVYEKLRDKFDFEPRGMIDIKGKGPTETWLLRV